MMCDIHLTDFYHYLFIFTSIYFYSIEFILDSFQFIFNLKKNSLGFIARKFGSIEALNGSTFINIAHVRMFERSLEVK